MMAQDLKPGENEIKKFDHGVITYQIEYLTDPNEKPLVSLLPIEMTYKFKGNDIVQYVEGWMGIFRMSWIVNYKDQTCYVLLKMFNENYYYESTFDNSINIGYNNIQDLKIEDIAGEVREIAGLKCMRAMVYSSDTLFKEPFEIYYSKEFDIKAPNINLSYKDFPNVLMNFKASFHKYPQIFNAVKFEAVSVDDNEFVVPKEYKKVTKEKFMELFSILMDEK